MDDGRYRIIGFGGGIRGTKTWGSLAALIALCRMFPGSRWAVIRKDLQRLRETVFPSFEKLRVRAGGFVGSISDTQDLARAARCANGSAILFRGENIDEDPQLNRFHGYEVNGFLNEEADELDERTLVKEMERAGTWLLPHGPQPPAYILNTFNPCSTWPRRVFYEPWLNGTIAPPYAFIPSTQADNPTVSDEQREAWKRMPDQEYRRFVVGDWTTMSGRFFDELSTISHKHRSFKLDMEGMEWVRLQDWWTYWGSYDWGFRHPAVAMAFAKDGDGQTYLIDTVRMHRLGDIEQAEKVKAALPAVCFKNMFSGRDAFNKREAHASSIETVADVFAKHSIYLQPANTARVQGWSAVRRMLTKRQPDGTPGVPKLLICDTPGNKWVVGQLLEMQPDPTDPEDMLKVDANDDGEGGDDAADCLRYGLLVPGLTRAMPGKVDKWDSYGRDPKMKQLPTGTWVGPEAEMEEGFDGGAGATLPIGYGM